MRVGGGGRGSDGKRGNGDEGENRLHCVLMGTLSPVNSHFLYHLLCRHWVEHKVRSVVSLTCGPTKKLDLDRLLRALQGEQCSGFWVGHSWPIGTRKGLARRNPRSSAKGPGKVVMTFRGRRVNVHSGQMLIS